MGLQVENYSGPQPEYGFDADGERVVAEPGYVIVPQGDYIGRDYKPFDIYAGWMEADGYAAEMGHSAYSRGRWTCWERPTAPLPEEAT